MRYYSFISLPRLIILSILLYQDDRRPTFVIWSEVTTLVQTLGDGWTLAADAEFVTLWNNKHWAVITDPNGDTDW